MSARIIQVGTSERSGLVVLYLCGRVQPPGQPHLDDQLRAALPDTTIVAYATADGEPLAATRQRAQSLGWPGTGPLCCVGYSAGCLRGVRQRLLDGAKPDAILCIDGTHASFPAADWQLDVWRPYIADARAGKRLFVATCTQQTYTEQLPAAKRFQATLTTLRQLTGYALAHPEPLPLGEIASDGALHVHNYASARIDGTAHSRQLTHVLPEMVRRYLAPWLAQRGAATDATPVPSTQPVMQRGSRGPEVGVWQARLHELGFDCGRIDDDFGPLTEAATKMLQRVAGLPATGQVDRSTRDAAEDADGITPTTPITVLPAAPDRANLSAALLDAARADLGVREERTNDGARIREYFDGTGIEPPAHWCAAALRYWLRAAGNACHVVPPIQGSVGAKVFQAQLDRAGRWIPAADLRREPHRLRPGMIAVWHRGAPNASTGHVGVVATTSGQWKFTSIEANSGARSNEVAEMTHNLSDANLLGVGWID